jgi:hypothetical protein
MVSYLVGSLHVMFLGNRKREEAAYILHFKQTKWKPVAVFGTVSVISSTLSQNHACISIICG